MAGLFFWRKKRSSEAEALPQEELSSYESSADTLAETTTGVDLPAATEAQAETPSAPSTPEKPKEKKPKFFKPKAKPAVVEPAVEVIPEPEPKVEAPVEAPVVEAEPEVEPEPIVEVVAPVAEPEPIVEVVAPVAEPAVAPAAEVELEQVELPKRSFAKGIKALFTRIKFDLENLDELEDTLIQSDFGVDAAAQIVESVKQRAKKQGAKTEAELKQILVDVIAEALEREDKQLNLADGKLPYVILVVGVNGVGKTTTIGKLANWLNEGQWRVVIGAADTFRAAAVEQIATLSGQPRLCIAARRSAASTLLVSMALSFPARLTTINFAVFAPMPTTRWNADASSLATALAISAGESVEIAASAVFGPTPETLRR